MSILVTKDLLPRNASALAVNRTSSPERDPQSQQYRRGFLSRWSFIPELSSSFEYSPRTKWFMTSVVAFAASTPSIGSAILLPSLHQVAEDFKADLTTTNLSIALFMLAMGICPLWWSFLSETRGRRTAYIFSFGLFVLFTILCAVSVNLPMLVAMRLLSGGAAASAQSVGAGTLADIWERENRGRAMGVFYLGPMCGPLFAPIVGGALGEKWGWRSTQWLLVLYGALVLVFIILTLPETSERKPSSLDSDEVMVKSKRESWSTLARCIFIDPIVVLRYLRFPPVFLTVYYSSIAFGSLYILNISLQDSYGKEPYNFSTSKVGLVYIPSSLGFLLASIFGGKWCDRVMVREAQRAKRYDQYGNLQYVPEDRMKENAWLAAVLFPVGLIWYGWAMEKALHWVLPMIGAFMFGIGAMLIFSMSSTMLTEFLSHKPSAGAAVNNLIRNLFSFTGSIAGQPLLDLAGNGWLFTGVGVIAALSASLIWLMHAWGPNWRMSLNKNIAAPS